MKYWNEKLAISREQSLKKWVSLGLSDSLLSINHNKTTYLQFRTMNSPKLDYNTLEISNYIASDSSTKFLGMIIDDKLTWCDQINQLLKWCFMLCFAFRISTLLLPDETLREIYLYSYFAYVHSILTYGIIFWGNSTQLLRYSECKKRLSASWQSLTIDPPVDSCLKNWEYCPSSLSIYYH